MGSSILASLSEAGGNDPFLPVSGPLPPHEPVGADRVGTRPTHSHMQVGGPNFAAPWICEVPIFNDLTRWLEKNAIVQHRFGTSSEQPSRIGLAVPRSRKWSVTFAISETYSLFSTSACGIMEGRSGLQ